LLLYMRIVVEKKAGEGTKKGGGMEEEQRNEGKEVLLLMFCLITFGAQSLCTVFPPSFALMQ